VAPAVAVLLVPFGGRRLTRLLARRGDGLVRGDGLDLGSLRLVVDLGLVYLCELEDADGATTVKVKMTLTAPGCGMGPVLANDVRSKIEAIPGVKTADVEVVFDPVWDRSMMSDAAKLQLGMMW